MGRTKIDLKQLESELRTLERHQALYRLLKRVLTELGYWRLKARYRPGSKGEFEDAKDKDSHLVKTK